MRDLPGLLGPGDVMVVNDTRVIPARLRGRRGEAAIEIMLNRADAGWQLGGAGAQRPPAAAGRRHRHRRRARPALPRAGPRGGTARLDFGPDPAVLAAALEQAGEIPLPPYIARPDGPRPEDREDYQTVFAARPGAVAAPTAGLHFTPALVAALEARGVRRATVTLHVGAGTFLPVQGRGHRGAPHACRMGRDRRRAAAALINAARPAGGRIVAIGTTSLRLLETAALGDGRCGRAPFRGDDRHLHHCPATASASSTCC